MTAPSDRVEFKVEQTNARLFGVWGSPPPPAFEFTLEVTAHRGATGEARDALRLAAYDLVARLDALDKAEERLK